MNTFKKEERLCSKKSLDLLFKKGSSFLFYPFRITYLPVSQSHSFPVQIVINVAKKRYKHAVDRNLIKRRTKEAYRKQKQEFLYNYLNTPQTVLLLSVQYVGKEIYSYPVFEKKMNGMLKKLIQNMAENGNH
ncbi:ribonuclease P protein component [Pedobacter montanisoli]|uniref:Ribonuclease P protein component n=1 Tax=Pedobacter montanisoli TaxID=2923277 RepID=A0ABS9ZZ57_9SPHI|nr:ribonuclease P protein component [Pedobacter montanisoli]MCJ0743606.1 ribonuclease P protein component [Pedobacter montanisoli]